MLPGNDLAWTHLREEPTGILFGRPGRREWTHSLSKAERAVSVPERPGERELTHAQFSNFLAQSLVYSSSWGNLIFIKVSTLHEVPVVSFHSDTLYSSETTRDSGGHRVTNALNS